MTNSTAQHSTAQHSTAQHSTAQHSTAIWFYLDKNRFWFSIFTLIVFIYGAFWARYGLDTYDGGFILGLSKRVVDGELPYNDFIYVRTPLTIYIHALAFLFDDYTFYFDRLITISQIAIYSFISAYLITTKFTEKKDFLGFTTFIIFIFSVHNFPLFGWHTVDAIFFSVIGALFYENKNFLTAGIFFSLAVLCKQNFILVLLFFILSSYSNKKLLSYMAGVSLVVMLFYLYLWKFNLRVSFLEQVFSQGSINDILKAGFINYIGVFYNKKTIAVLLISLLTSFWIFKRYNLKLNDYAIAFHIVSLFLFTAMFLVEVLRISGKNYSFFMVQFYQSKILLITAFLVIISKKQYLTSKIISLFLVSWCASISWGYMVPALFMAPCILPVLMLPSNKIKEISLFISLLATLSFFTALAYPYGESAKYNTFTDNPEFMQRVRLIKSSPEKVKKWEEAREISDQYSEKDIVVIPGFTQFDIVFNKKSISILDWEINAEIPNNLQSRVMENLCRESIIILIEKEETVKMINNSDYGKARFESILSKKVFDTWEKIQDRKYFVIYSCNTRHRHLAAVE